jgi:Bacterial Ig-like domain (group 3)
MVTKSMISLRGFARITIALLIFSALLSKGAAGQSASPLVTSSVSQGLAHPSTPAWGQIYNTAITTEGDWLVLDGGQGALYEFPANGGAMITLLAAGTMGSDPGLALDANNTLYLEGNWANCILRFPYDPSTKTWDGLSALSPANGTSGCSGAFIQYNLSWPDGEWGVQPKGLTTDINNNIIVGAYNGNFVAEVPVTVVNGTATPGTPNVLMYNAEADPVAVAVDPWENVYFVEDQTETGALPGVYEIPAGSANINGDAGLTRVDPNLPKVTGVATDRNGNLYVSDATLGVVFIPAAGQAASNPQTANAVLLTPNAAQGSVSIDWTRQIIYVPTTTTQSNGQADVAEVQLGALELGSTPVGTPTSPAAAITYAFTGSVTPASFAIQEDGVTSADFATATGGNCAAGTAYSEGGQCTVNVVENPLSVGGVSAKLLMLDGSNNVLASTVLHGTGLGSALSVSPALESAIGQGLKTPSQVATDAAGNSYVADAGLGQVLMYAKGAGASTAGVPVGAGLKAPTGVAVDGAGDVLIADSGNVIEVPYAQGGLNSAGQLTIKSGLGSNLKLAADGVGNLYVADPDNARVVKLGQVGGTAGGLLSPEVDLTGFTAPSAVAVDGSNNLYLIDNSNLIEVAQPSGTQTTLVSSLGAATGLAIDPSGAVYASLAGGTVRIPSVSGALNQSAETTVAASVTNPAGVAIDKAGNVYLADGTALNLHLVSIDGSLNFGLQSASTSLNAELLNIGNSALTITGYSSSDAEDFLASGCASAVSSGTTCTMNVTLNPGPGIQGPISSVIAVQGNAANSPVVVDASGTGSSLANSNTTIAVAGTATVLDVPVTVTVAPASGSGVPTGNVVISVDGANPTTTALANGTVTVTLSGIAAGSHTFSVVYVGDRTYGTSNATTTAAVLKAAGVLSIPTPPPYSLSTSDGDEPYDSSLQSYYTNFVVTVNGVAGLQPTGTISFMQGNSVVCGPLTVGGSASAPTPGQATFQPGCLTISANSDSPNELTPQAITSVVYSGDANYASSTATTTTAGGSITFEEIRQPSVAIGPSSATVNVSGGTGSTTLNITSVLGYGVSTNPAYPGSTPTLTLNNYTLPLGFACQGLPAYATCTFTGGNYTDLNGVLHPDEVVVNTDPSKPVSITVTINANASTGNTTSQISHSSPFAFASILGVGLFGLVFGRKSGRKGRAFLLICLVVLTGAMIGMTACSGTTQTASSALTTPSGTYPVTITAQQVGSISVLGNNGTPVLLYGSENQISLPYTLQVAVQ